MTSNLFGVSVVVEELALILFYFLIRFFFGINVCVCVFESYVFNNIFVCFVLLLF